MCWIYQWTISLDFRCDPPSYDFDLIRPALFTKAFDCRKLCVGERVGSINRSATRQFLWLVFIFPGCTTLEVTPGGIEWQSTAAYSKF